MSAPRGSLMHRGSALPDVRPHKLAVNQQPTPANVALYDAAKDGDLSKAVRCIDDGGSPNWFKNPEEGATAVHAAAGGGHVAVLEALLKAGAVLDDCLLTNYNTPLHVACDGGHAGTARVLLDAGAPIDAANAFGNTPLHVAIMSPRASSGLVRLLLERGADVRAKNNRASTPLHFLAYSTLQSAELAAVCEMLLEAGADVDAPDDLGMTALHIAARDGQPDLAAALLDGRALSDPRDSQGRTPCYYAEYRGHERIVKLLVA